MDVGCAEMAQLKPFMHIGADSHHPTIVYDSSFDLKHVEAEFHKLRSI